MITYTYINIYEEVEKRNNLIFKKVFKYNAT